MVTGSAYSKALLEMFFNEAFVMQHLKTSTVSGSLTGRKNP